MAAGQDLDRLGKFTVARDPAVLVPIGTDQVSQHPGITTLGLAASLGMAVTVAVDRSRVDRIHLPLPGRPVAGAVAGQAGVVTGTQIR